MCEPAEAEAPAASGARPPPRCAACLSRAAALRSRRRSQPVPRCSHPEGALYDSLDVRVGRVIKAWRHPEAEKLFVEEVEVGEAEPRTICSGLVGYVPDEELPGRLVVVLCNLKARNMRCVCPRRGSLAPRFLTRSRRSAESGVKSFGMLLAASDEKHENVELLSPPAGAAVGERVRFGDAPQTGPDSENKCGPRARRRRADALPRRVQKKKIWEAVQPELLTTAAGVAAYKQLPMLTSAGPVTVSRILGGRIS